MSAKCQQSVGEVSVNEKLYRPRHIWNDYRPCLDRLSTDYRPLCRPSIDRVSTDYRPSVDRVSTDCRPSVDRYIDRYLGRHYSLPQCQSQEAEKDNQETIIFNRFTMESDSACAKAIIYLLEITGQQISKTCRIHKLFTTSKIVYRISVTTFTCIRRTK